MTGGYRLVLDNSVSTAWFMEDEHSQALTKLLLEPESGIAIVPSLWKLEVANALQIAVRRGRITVDFRNRALFYLTNLQAAYLELAERMRLPLATCNMALRKAALECGIRLRGFPQDAP